MATAAYDPTRVSDAEPVGDPRRLVDRRVHRRRRPRVRRADPAARRRRARRRATGCSTSAAATGRSAGWPRPLGAELVVGVDPTWNQISVAARARRRPGLRPRRGRRPAVRRRGASTPSSPASCSSTSTRSTRRSPRWPGCCAPGGRFCFFLNHPLLQTPNSGWIDDQLLDPPEQYWRIGAYLVEDETIEEVEKDVFIPLRPPPARAATSTPWPRTAC